MISFSLQKKLHAANGNMLFDISHNIKPCSFIGIYGASGAGKTSLLRMLAGFLEPEKGFIKVQENNWYSSNRKINLAPQKRSIGFVFQDYALFPNMTVKENLLFAIDKASPKNLVEELLALVELEQLHNRKIQTLSGGQKQRVALARALVRKPDLLLLDEPLSALDEELRDKLQSLILNVHKQFNLTTLLVSHDIAEMIRLADEILFIKDGVVEKSGSPVEMFAAHNNGTLQLGGIVIDKINDELCLLIGRDLFRIKVDATKLISFEKGDSVMVNLETKDVKLKKLV
ncbi:ATP-binding cassette domain-containing protein [Panacibacter ginsenosidivorans]|uniref:ATP-binding cassette domain-containing protein n=1 Tax=Panacibacter ginsenosidivorans TaxID=1813871 RepID=A0A5B8VB08_9BACT|nr:ATP-binding cassette domain-containing protein [Panacibacter ginsenosidivorans]QEC68071.1 ATP-binding cassette domain-containing protein [Panacibacter ginsenosidivorans]